MAEDDGFRAVWPAEGKVAAFCRLEHLIPWAIQGWAWRDGEASVPEGAEAASAASGAPLGEGAVYLVRHRGGFRIPDGLASPEELLAWAKAGGRFA